jgi:hypothetical protein
MRESMGLRLEIARRTGPRGERSATGEQQSGEMPVQLTRRNARNLEMPVFAPTSSKKKGAPMEFNSTEILRFLADGGHIARDTSRDALVVKAANGSDLELELGGFAYSPVEVSTPVLSDLERARLVHEDRDPNGQLVYRAANTNRIAA